MQRTIDRVGRLTVTRRHGHAAHVDRDHDRAARLLHRREASTASCSSPGPAATETVTIEAIADAGEIGISPALARAARPGLHRRRRRSRRCSSCAAGRRAAARARCRRRDGIDIASCIPVAAREHVLLERSEPEHRTITAAFIDLMDTDELLADSGPDAFAEALDERICAIQEAALRYDVPFYETDVGKGSVKALLTAGAPSSTGHDEERMLRALREIMDQPGPDPDADRRQHGQGLHGRLRPAVPPGLPRLRRRDQHGCARDEQGGGRADPLDRDRARALAHDLRDDADRAVPGQGEGRPRPGLVVGPIAGVREAQRGPRRRSSAATRELDALLERARARSRQGNGWIVEISGEPGLGKSRLVAGADRRVRATSSSSTRAARSTSRSTPYFAFRAPMRTVLGLEPGADSRRGRAPPARGGRAGSIPTLVPWMPLLGILLGLDLPPTPETERARRAFLRETPRRRDGAVPRRRASPGRRDARRRGRRTTWTRRARTCCGGSRWPGAALRQLLLVTHSEPTPTWATVDGRRPALLRSRSCRSPRARTRPRSCALATDDDPLRPHEVEEIARRSGGQPAVPVRAARHVRDDRDDGGAARLGRGGDRRRDRPALSVRPHGAAVRLCPWHELRHGAARAAVGTMSSSTPTSGNGSRDLSTATPAALRFRNTLVRDAAYEGLPFRRRRELTLASAEAIEASRASRSRTKSSTLALHFFEAQRRDKAWHYCRLAGDRARAVAANVEAAQFYERALAAARRAPRRRRHERAEVWVALGAVREAAGLFDASFDALRRATRLLAATTPSSRRESMDLRYAGSNRGRACTARPA